MKVIKLFNKFIFVIAEKIANQIVYILNKNTNQNVKYKLFNYYEFFNFNLNNSTFFPDKSTFQKVEENLQLLLFDKIGT